MATDSPKLRERLQMHCRVTGGALYQHALVDAAGRTVGYRSTFINKKKKPWQERTTYFLGEQEFTSLADFLAAYEKQAEQDRRDSEWDAAAPAPESR